MKTSRVEYLGALQTKITHLKSGDSSITDAPVDNNGKGSRFSPTDLVAAALVTCILTVVGIHFKNKGKMLKNKMSPLMTRLRRTHNRFMLPPA